MTSNAAAAGGAGVLAGVAFDDDLARHHVLGGAGSGGAVHDDGRLLVHAGAVIADGPLDLDVERRIDADGDGVLALGVEHFPLRLVGAGRLLVQKLVELAQATWWRGRRSAFRSPLPEVDGCGLGLPDARVVDAGQAGERAVFGAEGDVLVGLGHDGRLAGDRVAQHAEAVLGADDEGEEAVEIVEALLQRFAEVHALVHAPGDVGGGDLGIVLGLEGHAVVDQLAAQVVVVGQRAVVHEALVGAGREGMRAHAS